MSFKIADAYVSVAPDDTADLGTNLRASLQAAVAEATEGLEAKVGLGLSAEAPEDFRADLDSALLLTTEDLEAHVGMGLSAASVEELDADVKAGIELVEAENKIKVAVDPKSAQEAGGEGASMILAALGAGLAIGPAALVTGMAAAAVAVTADVLKSNAVIKADYQELGTDGANAIKTATAPLTGDLNQALISLDGSIKTLQPDLDTLFAGVGPDIGLFESGVVSLASSALPGISTALNTSHADVLGFTNGLAPLGAGVGTFFTGLTHDATTTGLGIQSVMGTLGSVIGTTGSIVGSASSAISADLLAIDPVLNLLSGTLRTIADPATIGGLTGAFGAMKLDPSISTGLGNLSTRMLNLSERTADSSGLMDTLSGAALHSAGALNTAAGVMSGPWGIAIGAGVGLLSGFAGELINASHASDALTLSQDGLQKAIASDGAGVGEATAAYVAQSAAQDGLAASAAKAGVSLATWTSAVTGNKQAQDDVTAAVERLNAAQLNQITTNDQNAKDIRGGTTISLAEQAQATNTLTSSNRQLLSSMTTQAAQITSTISQQQQLAQATMVLNNNTQIFNATLDAARTAAQLQAQTAAQSSVALLGLGDTQSTLNMQLVNSETAYAAATGAAGAYGTALSAAGGSAATLLGAEASVTTALSSFTSTVKANGASLDVNTTKGAANIQAAIGMANAADKSATALYQSDLATKGASGAYQAANGYLEQQAQDFITAADKAGLNKTAVQQLANQLFQLPPNIDIGADTSAAVSAVKAFLEEVDNSKGVIGVTITESPGSRQLSHNAAGGPVQAGESSWVGEDGPEIVTFGADGYVTPNNQIRTLGGAGGAAVGGGWSGGGTTIYIGSMPLTMNGFADFTDPNNMSVSARRQAIQINNALVQVTRSRVGVGA